MSRLACQRCDQPLCLSERSWGQAYCRRCATALGLSRICDAPSLEVELDNTDIAGLTWDYAWIDEYGEEHDDFPSLGDLKNARGPDIAVIVENARCMLNRRCMLHDRSAPCDLCRLT